MRISGIELSALNLALKLPRSALSAELLARSIRRHGTSRRGLIVIGSSLAALVVLLHLLAGDPAVRRSTDLIAHLAAVKLIDARWDIAMLQVRADGPAAVPVVQSADVTRIQRTLDAAAAAAKSAPLRSIIGDLKKAYVEKADVVARYEKAAADSRYALDAAMRADAAVTAQVRSAWRDFPQRDRLVAAENLVARVLAEVQQYHHSPNAAHRAALETYVADLPRAHALPRGVQTGLQRLESDVHQVLLLKPLEQMLGERLAVLGTGARIDQLIDTFQRDLTDALARRDRYRVALIVASLAFLLMLAYAAFRAYAHYRDLRVLYSRRTADLAKALKQLRDLEHPASAPDAQHRDAAADETVHIISEFRR